MLILGIETSCDETGAAIIEGSSKSQKVRLLSNSLATSVAMHSKTGGIIPENAAREQVKFIVPVIKDSLEKAKIKPQDLDAIAVTYGPGLIGSLLVGVETAKALSMIWKKPLIPTNHLLGHIYANFISDSESAEIKFPAIGLIVSGGHTDLILIEKHGEIEWLGGTRDDAAGEAIDKIGRLLNLPYPAGPLIEKLAEEGDPKVINFPKPLIGSHDYDFSFSGLKTAAFRQIQTMQPLSHTNICDISSSVQKSIFDVVVKKTMRATKEYAAKSILLGGGVAANQTLRNILEQEASSQRLEAKIFVPQKFLCTDNGAMIAAAAFYNDRNISWEMVNANPGLYFD